MSEEKPWYCYGLVSSDGKRTYIGATVDPDRRLHQHNGAKSGGARATRGHSWTRFALVAGFPTKVAALQFEWAWKFQSRRLSLSGVKGRMAGLWTLLDSERATSLATPFSEWPSPPTVFFTIPDRNGTIHRTSECVQQPGLEHELQQLGVEQQQ